MLWTETMFNVKKPIFAMLHLDPLPGDPLFRPGDAMEQVVSHARQDLAALQKAAWTASYSATSSACRIRDRCPLLHRLRWQGSSGN